MAAAAGIIPISVQLFKSFSAKTSTPGGSRQAGSFPAAAATGCTSRAAALAALAAAPPLSDLHHASQWRPAGYEAALGRLEDFLRREGAAASGTPRGLIGGGEQGSHAAEAGGGGSLRYA